MSNFPHWSLALGLAAFLGVGGCGTSTLPAGAFDGGGADGGGPALDGGGADGGGPALDGGDADGGGPALDGGGADGGTADGGGTATLQVITMGPNGPVNAVWAAFQDGDGAFQKVEATSGIYALSPTAARFGFIAVCNPFAQVIGYFGTLAEGAVVTLPCEVEGPSGDAAILTGALSGFPQDDLLYLGAGTYTNIEQGTAETYQLKLPAGTFDLVSEDLVFPDGGGLPSPAKVLIERDIVVSSPTTNHDIDFSGASAVQPLEIDVSGVGPPSQADVVFVTPRTAVMFANTEDLASTPLVAVPASLLAETDIHILGVFWGDQNGRRLAVRFFADETSLAVTEPAPLTNAAWSTLATDPYYRYRFAFDPYPNAVLWTFGEAQWELLVTAGWLGAATSFDLPDLSGVAGWMADYAPFGGSRGGPTAKTGAYVGSVDLESALPVVGLLTSSGGGSLPAAETLPAAGTELQYVAVRYEAPVAIPDGGPPIPDGGR